MWWRVQQLVGNSLTSQVTRTQSENGNLVAQLVQLVTWLQHEIDGLEDNTKGPQVSELAHVLSKIQHDLEGIDFNAPGGTFEWKDGFLVRAMETGHWLLLDNVNLCPPSVLDRLNPVLEAEGELLLSESGTSGAGPRIIKAHPQFRVFMAMDPRGGEISRAMRNRCVEIAFVSPVSSQAEAEQDSSGVSSTVVPNPRDCITAIAEKGIVDTSIISFLIETHCQVNRYLDKRGRPPVPLRVLQDWASLVYDYFCRGACTETVLGETFSNVYGSQLLESVKSSDRLFGAIPNLSAPTSASLLLLCSLPHQEDASLLRAYRSCCLAMYLMQIHHLLPQTPEGSGAPHLLQLLGLWVGPKDKYSQPGSLLCFPKSTEEWVALCKHSLAKSLNNTSLEKFDFLAQIVNLLESITLTEHHENRKVSVILNRMVFFYEELCSIYPLN